MGFSLWKELRKRLRRGMRPGGLRLAAWLAAAACAGMCAVPDAAAAAPQALGTEAAEDAVMERIDSLSPAYRDSAVFGIDAQGRLSLFDGPPERGKVIRTFYQLNVRYMESVLPKERLDALSRGIRVTDRDEYNSVLSAYSEYAVPAYAGALGAS